MSKTNEHVINDMNTRMVAICKHCDHFVDENTFDPNDVVIPNPDGVSVTVKGLGVNIARYVHMEDGDHEFDHNATPGEVKTLDEWKKARPDLFVQHPDGRIGPNSIYHSPRREITH